MTSDVRLRRHSPGLRPSSSQTVHRTVCRKADGRRPRHPAGALLCGTLLTAAAPAGASPKTEPGGEFFLIDSKARNGRGCVVSLEFAFVPSRAALDTTIRERLCQPEETQ